MTTPGDLVTAATAEMHRALGDATTADWTLPAEDMTWTCLETAAHVADDLFSYASQVVAQPEDGWLPVEARLDDSATPEQVLQVVAMCGQLLRLAIDAAPDTARGWHPSGTSDPDGFAAMAVVEVLVHTWDITRGLGLDWRPPAKLCAAVLPRLFPDALDGDAAAVLLWCTGRAPLGDRPRQTEWQWDSSVHGGVTKTSE